MKNISLFILGLSIGCTSVSSSRLTSTRTPAQYNYDREGMVAQLRPDQYLTFKRLLDLIVSTKKTSIEDTLAGLRFKYQDYLKFHTLMYGSLSIQASSFEEPRALVFGPEARFIFSFNGNPSTQGGMSFETMEFSELKQSFEFREITFKKYPGFNLDEQELAPSEIEYQDENILVSKTNPQKCLKCHGEKANPIWQTYFLWPGAYGSNDDQLYQSFDKSSWNGNNAGFFKVTKKPSSLGRNLNYKPGAKDTELEGFVRYVKGKKNHPRYKWLPTHIAEIAVEKYADGIPFSDLDFSKESRAEKEKYHVSYEWPSNPNSYLLSRLQKISNDRLIRRLEAEGLQGAFSNLEWNILTKDLEKVSPQKSIAKLAQRIHTVISKFSFKNKMPSIREIERLLQKNYTELLGLQREKIYTMAGQLGPSQITYQVGINSDSLMPDSQPTKLPMEGREDFYIHLLKLDRMSDLDQIAITIEADNQVINTTLEILLRDRDIDLHDYNTTLRQMSVSFHSESLTAIQTFLGVKTSFGQPNP